MLCLNLDPLHEPPTPIRYIYTAPATDGFIVLGSSLYVLVQTVLALFYNWYLLLALDHLQESTYCVMVWRQVVSLVHQ